MNGKTGGSCLKDGDAAEDTDTPDSQQLGEKLYNPSYLMNASNIAVCLKDGEAE